MSLLDYYLESGISPVEYIAKDMFEHIERRESLYDMLGMPGLLFRGAKVLEIAAGSGQNGLYIASLLPSKYVIVEPNPTGLKQIKKTFDNFHVPHTTPEVKPVTLQQYTSDELFDLVICENWLGSADQERSLVGEIANRVGPGGMLVLTALSITGWLSNLIRYYMTHRMLAKEKIEPDSKVALLLEAFSPHLETITGMTRRHEDWVRDNMVNPTYLDQGLTLEMILEEIDPKGFTVFGASPNFITDWRWFKQLFGDNKKTNKNVLESINQSTRNFLDYRQTSHQCNIDQNRKLNELSKSFLLALQKLESKTFGKLKQTDYQAADQILNQISNNLENGATELSSAVKEALDILKSDVITPKNIASMKNFKPWFGRETLYFSFVRSNSQTAKN